MYLNLFNAVGIIIVLACVAALWDAHRERRIRRDVLARLNRVLDWKPGMGQL
jgi:hypothetical protein